MSGGDEPNAFVTARVDPWSQAPTWLRAFATDAEAQADVRRLSAVQRRQHPPPDPTPSTYFVVRCRLRTEIDWKALPIKKHEPIRHIFVRATNDPEAGYALEEVTERRDADPGGIVRLFSSSR